MRKLVFSGWRTPGLTDDEIETSIVRFIEYGLPLVSGGQLDQPAQWWDDVNMYRAIYNFTLSEENKRAKKRKKTPNA